MHKPVPSNILSEKEMEEVLTEAYLAEGYYSRLRLEYRTVPDSTLQRGMADMLLRHGIRPTQWDSSVDYYQHHLRQYDTIHHHVLLRLQQQTSNQ